MKYSAINPETKKFSPLPSIPLAMLGINSGYKPTPLKVRTLPNGAEVFIKDETERLGLTSFKALGGIYALTQLIGKSWHEEKGCHLTPIEYQSPEVKMFASHMTFVCASAGNHGLAVARGAEIYGAHARVHLSKTVPEEFVARLKAHGAEVRRSGENYEESVAAAIKDGETTGAILLADGSWQGYLEPPALVMEGYTVIAEELRQSFEACGRWPTYVFLQAGVGGLAAAMAYMIRENWAVQPIIIIVEPDAAPSLRDSHDLGYAVKVEGPVSAMGRLDCKEPSILALEVLSRTADSFVTVSDEEAILAANLMAEKGIHTTASGAAGYAGALKQEFNLGPQDRLLVIATEAVV